MISMEQFDRVFDCQKIFKALMNAAARPGQVFSLLETERNYSAEDYLSAIAMTLVDNRKTFFAEESKALEESILEQSYGVLSAVEEADYIFVPEAEKTSPKRRAALIGGAKIGTLPQPHLSATLFLMVPSFTGGPETVFAGPGIDGEITVRLPEQALGWIAERQARGCEFPCGMDLFFVSHSGEVMGMPRKIMGKGDFSWLM